MLVGTHGEESLNSGLDYLDYWTDLIMTHIIELSVFLVSAASTMATNYNNAYMEQCNCANYKVVGLRNVFSCWMVVSAY